MMFVTRCHQSRSRLLVDVRRAQRQIKFPRSDLRGRGSLGRYSIPPQLQNECQGLRCATTNASNMIKPPLSQPYDRTRALFFSVLQDDTFSTIDEESKEDSQQSTQFSAEALASAESKKLAPSLNMNERDQFLRHLVLGIQVNVQGIVASVDVAKTKSPTFSLQVEEEEDVREDEHAMDTTETKHISHQPIRAFQKRWNSKRKKERRRLGKLDLLSKGQKKTIEATRSSSYSRPSNGVAETREDDAWSQLWKAATAHIDKGSLTKMNQNGEWESDQSVSLDVTNQAMQPLGSAPVKKDTEDRTGMEILGTLSSDSFGAMEMLAEEDHAEKNMSDSKTNEFYTNEEEEYIIDALAQTIALVSIMSKKDWVVIDATDAGKVLSMLREDQTDGTGKIEAVKEVEKQETYVHNQEMKDIHQLLLDARAGKYVLTTLESNLLLSRLVTTTLTETNDATAGPDMIMSTALELYEEMVALGDSGQEDCAPDETTYQLLLLALDRRFLAQSEAVRLFQNMVHASSPKVNYGAETFLMGMQACYNRGDLVAAQGCMQKVVNETDNVGASRSLSWRPPAGAYLILCDMLQKEHAWREAIVLLDVALKVRHTCPFER
jgi:hypothetical protein